MTNNTKLVRHKLFYTEQQLYQQEHKQQQEHKHVTDALLLNAYPRKFLLEVEKKHARIKIQPTPSPEDLVKEFFAVVDSEPNSYAVLPYIKSLTEPLKRILKSYDICVTSKPVHALQHLFPSAKDRPPQEDQTNVIYKINCSGCSWSYIGETGRALSTRRKKHKSIISNIANHA